MTTSLETFEEILLRGDTKALKIFLQSASNDSRKKCAKKSLTFYKKAVKGNVKERSNGSYGWEWDLGEDSLKTSIHAVLATCSQEQLKAVAWNHSAIRLVDWKFVKELNPLDLTNFGDILINDSSNYFQYVRELMHLSLCQKPESENYIIGIISSPNYIYSKYNKDVPLKNFLLDEKDILDDILKIFDVEGTQEDSLASVDKYSSDNCNWQKTLIELCKDGYLERKELFEKCLDALSRDYIQYRSSWFSRFYEAMNPSVEERSKHLNSYGLLLGSSIPTTVSFSIKALKKLSSKQTIESSFIEKNITPALYAKSKSTVNTALALIEASIKSNKEFAQTACMITAESLAHESPDVQKKAIEIIQKYGDKNNSELTDKVKNNIEFVAATVLPLINSWIGIANKSSKSIPENKIKYSQDLKASEGWPFRFYNRIDKIETLEELISVASFCLEHPEEILEFERVINAVSQIEINRDEQFKKETSALNKRALHFYSAQMYSVVHLHRLHAGFLYAWINKSNEVFRTDKISFFKGLFHKESFPHINEGLILERDRLASILKRNFENIYLPVLSTPTHFGGWIETSELHNRFKMYKSNSSNIDDNDLILAMNRSPKSSLIEYFKNETTDDELCSALRYQCGLIAKPKTKNKLIEKAASFLRDPVDPETQINFGKGSILTDSDLYETSKWLLTAFPILKETYYNANLSYAYRCIDYMDVNDLRIKAILETFLDSGAPLEENAIKFLSHALVVEESSCRGMATEALIIAIEESRLPLELLSKNISKTLHAKYSKPKRLASSLQEVARASALHSSAVIRIIELVLTKDGSKAPKGLIAVLELLNEVLAQQRTKIKNEETKAYLSAITTGGKTKTIVKQLLS